MQHLVRRLRLLERPAEKQREGRRGRNQRHPNPPPARTLQVHSRVLAVQASQHSARREQERRTPGQCEHHQHQLRIHASSSTCRHPTTRVRGVTPNPGQRGAPRTVSRGRRSVHACGRASPTDSPTARSSEPRRVGPPRAHCVPGRVTRRPEEHVSRLMPIPGGSSFPRGLLELLYPPACLACAQVLPARAFFCETCDTAMERVPPACCRTCAEPGRFPSGECPRCHIQPPPFARAWAPFAHEGPVARAIHRFKYEDHPELAEPLGELLAHEAHSFLAALPRCSWRSRCTPAVSASASMTRRAPGRFAREGDGPPCSHGPPHPAPVRRSVRWDSPRRSAPATSPRPSPPRPP